MKSANSCRKAKSCSKIKTCIYLKINNCLGGLGGVSPHDSSICFSYLFSAVSRVYCHNFSFFMPVYQTALFQLLYVLAEKDDTVQCQAYLDWEIVH